VKGRGPMGDLLLGFDSEEIESFVGSVSSFYFWDYLAFEALHSAA